jgi:hypothetical protein
LEVKAHQLLLNTLSSLAEQVEEQEDMVVLVVEVLVDIELELLL